MPVGVLRGVITIPAGRRVGLETGVVFKEIDAVTFAEIFKFFFSGLRIGIGLFLILERFSGIVRNSTISAFFVGTGNVFPLKCAYAIALT